MTVNYSNPLTLFRSKKLRILIAAAALVLALCITLPIILTPATPVEAPPEIVTATTLEKIISTSELSTYTAVYNGIAEVYNPNNPEQLDYYVSYCARVNAGIDFCQVKVEINEESKNIYIHVPEVYITDVNVDITSMDFMFYNSKANTSTVTEAAYKACEADVTVESERQGAIRDLARQNAINILTALTKPIVEQWDINYTLIVE